MKKLILQGSLYGMFILTGLSASAQASKVVADKIDASTSSAIYVIKENKTLSHEEKQKFIDQLNTISETAKKQDDKGAKMAFSGRYKITDSYYYSLTNQNLPELPKGIKTDN